MDMARAKLHAVQEDSDQIDRRLADLTVRSPQAGTIIGGFLKQFKGQYIKRGEVICRVLDMTDMHVTALIDQPQNATQFLEEGVRVELRTAGNIGDVIPSRVIRDFKGGRNTAPEALTTLGGGQIAMAPDDSEGRRTLRPQFELWLDLPKAEAQPPALPGQRVYVRFTLAQQRPLIQQWIHRIRQIVRDRLSL